jgi:ribosomal protein S18 acetylase RimI-like enzyme
MSADAPVTEDVAAGPSVWICDFTDAEDRLAFARLMAEFAAEPVSASPQLGVEHFTLVADDLAQRAGTLVLFAAREEADDAEGILVAFEGYTTFGRAQLFNIHDVHVSPIARGVGLGTLMINALIDVANEHRFAKLTLEVSASNARAIALYLRLGFTGLERVGDVAPAGAVYFMSKKL